MEGMEGCVPTDHTVMSTSHVEGGKSLHQSYPSPFVALPLSPLGSLIDRERSLRAEETRRFSVLEVRARESADDISRARTRAELDILEEK
jgi:hypothetical protein